MDIYLRITYSLFTLYMLLILLRWMGPWIGFEMTSSRWKWACRLTDPLIDWMRRLLPPMGPIDFGPIAALTAVWLLRFVSIRILLNMGIQG